MPSRTLHSCIYRGTVRHRRFAPVRREFRYRLYLLYLDLEEIPILTRTGLFGWLHGLHILRFDRRDHPGDPQVPLAVTIRDMAEEELGRRPGGPIRLLTQLRHFGYVINPISLYYCFRTDGISLDCVVAEVINTPWNERHCYVVDCQTQESSRCHRQQSLKQMHVSPFLPMEMEYRWKLTTPGRRLLVHLDDMLLTPPAEGSPQPASRQLDATLVLQQRPLTAGNLLRCLIQLPLMTFRITAAIYLQALRLWYRGVPFHPHPDLREPRCQSAPNRQAG